MGGSQGGCEWRSEAFVKIQKKKNWKGGGVGSGGGGVRVEGGGGRADVYGEVKTFLGGRGVGFGGVRVDGNGELKLL